MVRDGVGEWIYGRQRGRAVGGAGSVWWWWVGGWVGVCVWGGGGGGEGHSEFVDVEVVILQPCTAHK